MWTKWARLLVDVGPAAPLSMEPDEDADRAYFQRTGFQVHRGEPLRDVVGDIGSVPHRPSHSGGGDEGSGALFNPGFHHDSLLADIWVAACFAHSNPVNLAPRIICSFLN